MFRKSTSSARAGFARTIDRWLGRVLGPRRNADADLARMSERELRDLGIGRSEIGWWGDSRAVVPRTARDGDKACDASRHR